MTFFSIFAGFFTFFDQQFKDIPLLYWVKEIINRIKKNNFALELKKLYVIILICIKLINNKII